MYIGKLVVRSLLVKLDGVEKPIYLIDLDRNKTYGLCNQLFSIVEALMLGHFVRRDIETTGFYPQYNSAMTVPLEEVIDIDETNELLQYFISSKLSHSSPPGQYSWNKSVAYNPFHKSRCFWGIVRRLEGDLLPRMSLGETFSWYYDSTFLGSKVLNELFINILYSLVPSRQLMNAVEQYKKQIGLGGPLSYYSIHLRLEDDWVKHKTKNLKYNKYIGYSDAEFTEILFGKLLESMKRLFLEGNKKIFVATGLLKSYNKNTAYLYKLQEMFPNLVFATEPYRWEKSSVFYSVEERREVDAYIDYIICRESSAFIGFQDSTFSINLDLCLEKNNVPTFLID